VALAAVLGASACEIYTDVDGIYTTDPRVVPEARKIDRISYDEMLELASLGAGVMHSRSIEFAKKYGVPIHVRSSFSDSPGTWIVGEGDARRLGVAVTGAVLAKDEARVTILGVPDRPGVVHALFSKIAAAKIVVDMIVQNVALNGTTEVSFTVATGDLAETSRVAEAAAREIGAKGVAHDPGVAKVSAVGLGMSTHTGVATAMFDVLAREGVNIQMITTSEIKISVLVDRGSAVPALRAIHKVFELERTGDNPLPSFQPAKSTTRAMKLVPLADADPAEPMPTGMEDLVTSGVELDETQARITLFHLADQPGQAAHVFRAIADAGVFVDMIVQNAGIEGTSVLSFTVPRDAADRAAAAVARSATDAEVAIEPELAKLSVLGVGMRTHTGVAARMFGALAERAININLINTSEVRINVGTDIAQGKAGLQCLKEAFSLTD
jgi:aspartate kinase